MVKTFTIRPSPISHADHNMPRVKHGSVIINAAKDEHEVALIEISQ